MLPRQSARRHDSPGMDVFGYGWLPAYNLAVVIAALRQIFVRKVL